MRTPNFDQMGWSPLDQEAARALPPPIPLHMALAGMMGESGEAAMRLLHKWSLENAFNWETVREELRARHRINDLVGACAALFAPQEEQSALLELIWQALAAPTSVSPNLAAIVFALDPDFLTKAEQLGTALAAIPLSSEAYNAFMQAQRALAAILALGSLASCGFPSRHRCASRGREVTDGGRNDSSSMVQSSIRSRVHDRAPIEQPAAQTR